MAMASCRMPGWPCCVNSPTGPGCGRRSPSRWPTRTGARVQDATDTLNLGHSCYPAIDTNGGIRDGAWVAEATGLVDLSSWPAGTRLILRKERPHPGAQLRFTDADGMRAWQTPYEAAPHWLPELPAV